MGGAGGLVATWIRPFIFRIRFDETAFYKRRTTGYTFMIRNHLVRIYKTERKILLIRLLKQTFFFTMYVFSGSKAIFWLGRQSFVQSFLIRLSQFRKTVEDKEENKTANLVYNVHHHPPGFSPDSFKYQPVRWSRVKVITFAMDGWNVSPRPP